MTAPVLNSADMDTALDAFKADYERLVKDGIDPGVVVIAMSELVAYCLAQKAVTGGGESQTLRIWLDAFEASYRAHVVDATSGR